MRKNLLHPGASELSYEIREIVEVARKIEKTGMKITWENIGDPVEKGEAIPTWLKEIVCRACTKDEVYAYSPTRGLDKTLEYLSKNNPRLEKTDILFFNGLGDAINKIYKSLAFDSRVIGPNPAYSTHSSAEAAHAGSPHITYKLDLENNWNPDLVDLENKVQYNPNIVGILVINPDNPTGAVFKKEVLEKIIDIARRYDLFVVFDEIYEKLIFSGDDRVLLSDIIGEVPGISMKGISKELPWPGARCGWIEVYNKDKNPNFSRYINSILASKMLEVCSTTLPQYVIPEVYENKEFYAHLKERRKKYKLRADLASEVFSGMSEVTFVAPKGAFYSSIVFNLDKLNKDYKMEFENKGVNELISGIVTNSSRFDKKFCYYLLAKKGVCIVPLSGFNSTYDGFRMTLLEDDLEKYKRTLNTIKEFILEFKK
ncbi:MAG: pyridoxal phosphate-dependent aminotransferase [Candidatus Gracilibacteria bacterium]|nr:pyridoxal phosphate-dependent aminotransferase [Candidatus Gracilibacteria bacterium]